MVEIPPDLQEKLKVIELETGFLIDKPSRPKRLVFSIWVAAGLLLAGIVLAISGGDYLPALIMFLVGAFIMDNNFQQQRLFQMYSDACEIIKFYKSTEKP